MAMVNNSRQWVLAVEQQVEAADLVAGLSAITIELPPGAIIVGGGTLVVTPNNAAGAAVLDIGLVGGSASAFANDVGIKTAGYTAFATGVGTYLPNGGSINLTGALTSDGTVGDLRVIVQYIVVGRGNEVQ